MSDTLTLLLTFAGLAAVAALYITLVERYSRREELRREQRLREERGW